jgi:hypothetical protein
MFKVIIAGGRDFKNYDYLKVICDKALSNQKDIQIVSGGAYGADKLGEKYARENEYCLKVFPADWGQYGKAAGYIRNEEMAKYADACIVFWDGESKGSKHMIDLAKKHNLKVKVYGYGRRTGSK